MFEDLSQDIFERCQLRIQHVYDEHTARVLNLERIKAEGGITTEDGVASNTASRTSFRVDSPDTTDSSRPDTGNAAVTENPSLENFGLRQSANIDIMGARNASTNPRANAREITNVEISEIRENAWESRTSSAHTAERSPPLFSIEHSVRHT